MNTSRYYQESGAASPAGILMTFGARIAAALVLGALYGILSFINPFVYVNFLGAIFLGVGVGMAVGKSAGWGSVRNTKIIMAAGALAGVLTLYAAWVGWLFAGTEFTEIIARPGDIFATMGFLGEVGVYEIFGFAPTGGVLYAIWGIEAAIIVGSTFLNTLGNTGRQPYCEECEDWTHEEIVTDRLEVVRNPGALIKALEAHDMTAVTDLAMVSAGNDRRTKVSLHKCNGCSGSKYLTVDGIEISYDNDGDASVDETPLVENLVLTNSDYATLQEWKQGLLVADLGVKE